VANTVNHVIRRDPELSLTASHGGDLYWLTTKLGILLKVCFLQELGFSEDKIRSFYARNRVYQHLSRLVNSQRGGPSH
jgi:HEPN superfamily Apea-like protein